MLGPKCCDLLSRDPNEGSQILEPIKRSEVRGPKYLHVNTVMNVHVSMKLTVGTLEAPIRSIVSNPLTRVGKSGASIRLG